MAAFVPRVRREAGPAVDVTPAFAGMGSCVPTSIEHVTSGRKAGSSPRRKCEPGGISAEGRSKKWKSIPTSTSFGRASR